MAGNVSPGVVERCPESEELDRDHRGRPCRQQIPFAAKCPNLRKFLFDLSPPFPSIASRPTCRTRRTVRSRATLASTVTLTGHRPPASPLALPSVAVAVVTKPWGRTCCLRFAHFHFLSVAAPGFPVPSTRNQFDRHPCRRRRGVSLSIVAIGVRPG
jgi:hypothetical protein